MLRRDSIAFPAVYAHEFSLVLVSVKKKGEYSASSSPFITLFIIIIIVRERMNLPCVQLASRVSRENRF